MSEQAQILSQMHQLILGIMATGIASPEQNDKMDELEDLLMMQSCFHKSQDGVHEFKGEEIATHFFKGEFEEAMEKMCDYKITPDDFFGFVQYHYDDEHVDEDKLVTFTRELMKNIYDTYAQKCN